LYTYRCIGDFKKGFQPVTNTCILQHENGDLFAESYSVLSRGRNHFFDLLNVNGVYNVRQTEILTAEPLVPEPSAFEFEINVIKLQTHNHHLLNRFPHNLLKQGVETFAMRFLNLLILFGIRRNCLRSGRSQSLYLFIRRVIKQTVVIYPFCQLHSKFYPVVKVNSICRGNYWGSSICISTQQINY